MAKKHRGVFEKEPGSGVWWIRWQDERGKIRRKKIGPKAMAIAAAEQKRARVRLRHVAPELVAEPRAEMLLADLLDYRLCTSGNEKSAREEARHARDWRAWLPGMGVNEVTTAHLEEWLAWRLSHREPATANRALAFLSACYTVAVREGWSHRNPCLGLRARENNKRTGYLDLEDFFRLMDEIDPEPFTLIEFAVLSGLRQADQFELRKEELELDRGGLWAVDPKSGKKKWVSLSSRCVEILRHWCAKTPRSEWVFAGKRSRGGTMKHLNAKHFSESVLYPALRKIGIKIGVTGITWHSLRHTFASWLAEGGVDLSIIQVLMDHGSQRTTERYRHASRARADSAVEALANMVRAPITDTRKASGVSGFPGVSIGVSTSIESGTKGPSQTNSLTHVECSQKKEETP